jgi:hypothetical protein
MSTFVPVINCNILDVWDIYRGWMMQETPRKYANLTCTKSDKRRPKARWKAVQNGIRKMGIVNWRQVMQDRDG